MLAGYTVRVRIVWIYLWKIQGDLFSGCVHITFIIETVCKMAGIMWYSYSFGGSDGRRVVQCVD